jgi:hypothetical protein
MLGIGYEESDNDSGELESSLQEVKTGEGYSKYLSNRDKKSFERLFSSLAINDSIHYGTFNEMCEYVINSKVAVRDETCAFVTGIRNRINDKNPAKTKVQVLLIDQVDVFFSKDFYGNIYMPASTVVSEKFDALVNHLWSSRNDPKALRLVSVANTRVYSEFLFCFKGKKALPEEVVKSVVNDLRDFTQNIADEKYVVQNDRIGYKEQDWLQRARWNIFQSLVRLSSYVYIFPRI